MSISANERKGSVQGPTIRLDPEVHVRIRIHCARTGETIQAVTTRAVNRYLDELAEQEAHADDVA